MLGRMQESAETVSVPRLRNFASVLAGLAGAGAAREAAWNGEGLLEDDVATISYEQALRRHGRARPAGDERRPDAEGRGKLPASPEERREPCEQKLRSASVTIRLSHAERAQLHERAAAAGMTISAYLRSCIFEVESLRAQVKQTVAEMRAAGEADGGRKKDVQRVEVGMDAGPGWRRKLFPHWGGGRFSGA